MRLADHAETVNVIVPAGALGSGIREEDVARGLAAGAHAVACDAGSTDSGPAYLATGRSKYAREAVKADLRILMRAQAAHSIPLLIGSCGTSGCAPALDWTRDIAVEIAAEECLSPRIALIYADQDPADLAARARAGRITALPPLTSTDPALFAGCEHIVALMGAEPYVAAIRAGADVVLGGRTTDTALIAAVPLMRGAGAGPAWHAGKIAECGGQCTVRPRDGGVMVRIGREFFEVEPLSPTNACRPESVSAHMLYENADPFRLPEPGGILDASGARYQAVNDRVVRVEGSRFEPQPYTMKLEGAATGDFQTIMLVGIRDPLVLAELDSFLPRMEAALAERARQLLGEAAGSCHISLRAYGWNAVDPLPAAGPPPGEVGLLFVATAPTQILATEIARACNFTFFHLPLRDGMELPSYAFPFSPAEIERGPCHDFRLNHVVAIDDPFELVRIRFVGED
jgi:hypothetical protein